jgi:hypothetical protein
MYLETEYEAATAKPFRVVQPLSRWFLLIFESKQERIKNAKSREESCQRKKMNKKGLREFCSQGA